MNVSLECDMIMILGDASDKAFNSRFSDMYSLSGNKQSLNFALRDLMVSLLFSC